MSILLEIEKEQDVEKKLAIALHNVFCHSNHTDMCSWYYEVSDEDPWIGYAHKDYLDRAKEIWRICQEEDIKPIIAIKIILATRKFHPIIFNSDPDWLKMMAAMEDKSDVSVGSVFNIGSQEAGGDIHNPDSGGK